LIEVARTLSVQLGADRVRELDCIELTVARERYAAAVEIVDRYAGLVGLRGYAETLKDVLRQVARCAVDVAEVYREQATKPEGINEDPYAHPGRDGEGELAALSDIRSPG
jgi:hypothetical protein